MRLKHLFPLLALLLFTVAATDCGKNIRTAGRSLKAVAIEAKGEITSMQEAGEIEESAAGKYKAVLSEVEANSHDLTLIGNWDAMSPAEKRRTIVQQITNYEASARRLDEAGVLGIKSAKARKRVEEFKRNFQRGIGALRIIEASIPAEQ